ncbi:MAG: 3-deoxy-7-phosphoheptulonate synthase [Thermoplasmata archaeon]|nr:3-deoxy-7-phosphoheptulonate synthase [Thermoplasmata archaeon]
MAETADLEKLRKKVRAKDRELVALIAERFEITSELGRRKAAEEMRVEDPEVERAVVKNALAAARELDLDPGMTESIMRSVIASSRIRQEGARNPTAAVRPNIAGSQFVPPPLEFRTAIPVSRKATASVRSSRKAISEILDGKDDRKIIIMGPCSVHDIGQAEEFAGRLQCLQKEVNDRFLLVMRAYIEKSRSGRGWTGFIGDPYMNGSGDIQHGITETRKFLKGLAESGIPSAVEFINPITALYIGDLVSWAAIGARSSGSQLHRDMASGLDMPVGFKNGPDGDVAIAVGAIQSAGESHHFLGADETGNLRAFRTLGNRHCHLVLRGGEKPNFDSRSVRKALKELATAGLPERLIVDCSHGNSGKVADGQMAAFEDVIKQISAGDSGIIGLMLESNLKSGKQRIPEDLAGFKASGLKRGISVTDECLGWDATEKLILKAYRKMK